MSDRLTAGAIARMISGEVTSQDQMMPVLEVKQLRRVPCEENPRNDDFRVVLSDGTQFLQGVLGTDLIGRAEEGLLRLGSIVRLTGFQCPVSDEGRRGVIVTNLEVMISATSRHNFLEFTPDCSRFGTLTSSILESGIGSNLQSRKIGMASKMHLQFYYDLYELVDDPWTDSIISWSKSNKSFVIRNQEELIGRNMLSRFLFCRNLDEFISRLEISGFKQIKTSSGLLEFGDKNFVRGRPELMEEMEKIVSMEKMFKTARLWKVKELLQKLKK